MQWAELDDKERVRLLLQHVMGCFVMEATAQGWHWPELPRGQKALDIGFHSPFAYWNTDGDCWMIEGETDGPDPFEPLREWNATWRVVQCMKEKMFTQRLEFFNILQRLVTAATDLNEPGKLIAWPNALFYVSPEMICLAALKAVGIEVN